MARAPIASPLDTDPPIRWAQYYLSLGWTLSHFAPGTKGPEGKGWNTPEHWIDAPEKAKAQWRATPAHGMGVIHEGSGTVALDVDDVDRTRLIFREFGLDLDRVLAGAPRVLGKKEGRAKAIFRAPEGEPLKMHKAVWKHPTDQAQSITLFELRAGAVHDCLPPSQHPDGHQYEWLVAPWQLDGGIPALPADLQAFWREFPALKGQIAAMAPWAGPIAAGAAASNGTGPVHEPGGHQDIIGQFNRTYEVTALLEAHGYERHGVRYLAPSSTSKIPGVSILPDGRVYSHHGSDVLADGHAHDAFDLFTLFEHHGDTKAAVRHAADLLGASPLHPVVPAMDLSDFMAAATSPAKRKRKDAEEPPTFPRGLLEVPGLVGDIATYINRTARYPQPILALGAAIAAAATLMGRKVRTESDLRTNVYILAVAEAGAGKEYARHAVRKIFDQAGAFVRVTVENIASDAALQTALVACPSSLFLLDEIGRLLAVLNDRTAPGHLSEIITQLLKLYGAANGTYCGKVYADPDRNQVVQQPNLSIYGTTVPGALNAALTTTQVEDGFLSRLMIFESETPDPEPVEVAPEPPPLSLVEACVEWERALEHDSPETANVDAVLRPHPRVVVPDAAARRRLADFEAEMRGRRIALRAAQENAGLYVRTAANAQKLALIRAAGRRPGSPVIERDDAEWACELARHLADSMTWRIRSHVSENIVEKNVKRLAQLVRAAGAIGMSKSELTRRTQWLRQSERGDVLQTLTEAGQVVTRKLTTKGRPSERVIWTEFAGVEDQTEIDLSGGVVGTIGESNACATA